MAWVMVGHGGSWWVIRGVVSHAGVDGSCRVGWVMVGWVMQGWGG